MPRNKVTERVLAIRDYARMAPASHIMMSNELALLFIEHTLELIQPLFIDLVENSSAVHDVIKQLALGPDEVEVIKAIPDIIQQLPSQKLCKELGWVAYNELPVVTKLLCRGMAGETLRQELIKSAPRLVSSLRSQVRAGLCVAFDLVDDEEVMASFGLDCEYWLDYRKEKDALGKHMEEQSQRYSGLMNLTRDRLK